MLLDALIALAAAAALSAALSPLVIAAGVPDAPDVVRKAHSKITPTSGGLAIGAAFALSFAALCLWPGARWPAALAQDSLLRIAGAAGLAFGALALGVADDLRPLGPRVKFGLMAGLSLAAALLVAHAEALPLALGLTLNLGFVLGVLGSGLWMFTLVNATNFMDGANGLAMGSTAISLMGLAAVSAVSGAPHAAIAALAAAGALVGFLVWNFPNGKIFAGDSGSLFAGAIGALLSLIAIQEGNVSPFIPAILFFPVLADVLLTLAWRKKRGRSLLNSHRDHLFQIGLRGGLSHFRVSLAYWAATAHCALIAFLASFGTRVALVEEASGAQTGLPPLLVSAAAFVASAAPALSLAVLAWISVRLSTRLRAWAAARGLDGE